MESVETDGENRGENSVNSPDQNVDIPITDTKGDNSLDLPNTEINTQSSSLGEMNKDEQTKSETEDEDIAAEISVDPDVIEKLTVGTLGHYLPNLQKAKSSLDEILQNQNILTETVQQENNKFTDCTALEHLTDTMSQARRYYAKLYNLKKEMQILSDKSFKLKKRALKLQQQKQKQELQREQQRENELEKERKLVAQPSKPH